MPPPAPAGTPRETLAALAAVGRAVARSREDLERGRPWMDVFIGVGGAAALTRRLAEAVTLDELERRVTAASGSPAHAVRVRREMSTLLAALRGRTVTTTMTSGAYRHE